MSQSQSQSTFVECRRSYDDVGAPHAFVNVNKIQWMKKKRNERGSECFYMCTDSRGCMQDWDMDKMVVCKAEHPRGFDMLDKMVLYRE